MGTVIGGAGDLSEPATQSSVDETTTVTRGIIEVLNRSGQVLQRLSLPPGRYTVGRGYDNDVIVGDPYVDPHHLLLEVRADGVEVSDRDTVNGTWVRGGRRRVPKARLASGASVHIGHSQLRYHAAAESVPAAWRDATSHGLLSLLRRPLVLLLVIAGALAGLLFDAYLEESRVLSPVVAANGLVYPVFGMILWAGFWSLLNRLTALRPNFAAHMAITCLAMVGLVLADELVPAVAFALGWLGARSWLSLIAEVAVAGTALYAHIQYLQHGRSVWPALGAGMVAALVIGSPLFGDWLRRDEFSSAPRLEPLLQPPAVRRVPAEPLDQFLRESRSLRETVDQAREGS